MKSRQWLIIIRMALIFFLIWKPLSIQATISTVDHFFPTTTGEIWEREFHLDATDGLIVYFQIGAFAKYNITISLDSIDSAPYSVLCSIKTPPNYSLNTKPEIRTGRLEKFSLTDGEKLSYLATSYIHLGRAYINLRWNERYTIPADGISGKITIHVIDLGLQDDSLYRTEFRLNSNQSSFEFEFEPMVLLAEEYTSYGKETELRAVVSLTANSTGTVRLNISDSFMDTYNGEHGYPQKFSTLQPMNVSPGTTQEQIIIQNNDEYDSFIHIPFLLSLINSSTTAFGNLTIYLHKLGKQLSTDASTLGMILVFIGIVVIVRKKVKKDNNLN